MRLILSAGLSLVLLGSVQAADVRVTIKGVHLCCGNCVKTVKTALGKIKGVYVACNLTAKTVNITAPDAKTAQKAVDALAASGFHGTSSHKEIAIKDDSKVEKGKVKSLTLGGVHNCCDTCTKVIKATLKKVQGVQRSTVKPMRRSFTIRGHFDALEVVKALNAAGFHCQVVGFATELTLRR